jgi:hypothetical protein
MRPDPKRFRILFISASGREYTADLQATGDFHTQPPAVVWERDDDTVEAAEVRYSSLEHLAIDHGLIFLGMTSAEPVN